jgi:hypothetical protein
MAEYHETNVAELLDEDSIEPVAPPKRNQSWKWKALTAAVACTMGAAIMCWPKHATGVDRLRELQRHIVREFTSGHLRNLQDSSDVFVSDFSFLFNEEGKADPDKMGVRAEIQQAENHHTRMSITTIFRAKEGKRDDLVQTLQAILDGQLKMITAMDGEDAANQMKELVEISAGSAEDEATVKVVMPDDDQMPEDQRGEVRDAVGAVEPKLVLELSTGRDIGEMWDHMDDNIAVTPAGIKFKSHSSVAAAMMEMASHVAPVGPPGFGAGPPPGFGAGPPGAGPDGVPPGLFKGFASFGANMEVRYRSDSGGAFDDLPRLKDAVAQLAAMSMHLPASVREPMVGLDDSADGIKTVKVQGLPDKWEMVATFKNFHIAPLLKDVINHGK